MKLTKPQQKALKQRWLWSGDPAARPPFPSISYLSFRRTVEPTFDDSVMVKWCGMYLGIETDGYCHS